LSQWTGHLEASLDDPKVTVYVLKRFVEMMDEAGVRQMLSELNESSSLSQQYARSLHRSLIRIQYRAGDSQLSLRYIDERLDALSRRELDDEAQRDVIWNLSIKGRLLRRMARYGEALQVFDRSIEMLQRLGLKADDDDRRRLASTYLVRGETYAEFGEFEKADLDFRAAEAIYTARLGIGESGGGEAAPLELMDYGRFLRTYGEMLAYAGRNKDAVAKFAQSHGIYDIVRQRLGEGDSADHRRLQRHWIDLMANEHVARAELDGPRQVPDELLKIAEETAAELRADPENLRTAERAGLVRYAVALTYERAERPAAALEAAQEALAIHTRIAGQDSQNAEWQRTAAESALLTARLLSREDGPDDRIVSLYADAIGRLKAVTGEAPDTEGGDADVPGLRMLARAERSVADYLRRAGDAEAAVVHYRNAVTHGRWLVNEVNDNPYWRADLAESLSGLARAHWQTGQREAALEPLGEARLSWLDWLRRDPADGRRVRAYVGDTKAMSEWLRERGETAEARRLAEEARTVLTELKDDGKLPAESWRMSLDALSN
jgi:tetratricopeptide (TPR) repeat protein